MEDFNPMEVFFQRRGTKYIYIVPEGLKELMADITREVLRFNPENINSFIADFLDSLLITRENARVAFKIVDNLADSSVIMAEILMSLKITKEQAKHAAIIIQRAFRKYKKRRTSPDELIDEENIVAKLLRRSKITIEQACKAAQIIQRAYRCYRAKLQEEDRHLRVDWALASRRTIGLFRDTGVPRWELERAATLIKAAYKGYYTRRILKRLMKKPKQRKLEVEIIDTPKEESKCDEYPSTEAADTQLIDYDLIMYEIQQHAARIIQRAFRRYLEMKYIEIQHGQNLVADLHNKVSIDSSDIIPQL